MNLRLDRLVRRLAHEPRLRERADTNPTEVATEEGVAEQDLAAALHADLATLSDLDVHPLLLMQLAGAMGVDPLAMQAAELH